MMRGYFGLGVEGISKRQNLGNLMRTAHAFGASFFFSVDARTKLGKTHADTSKSNEHIPYYPWADLGDMMLPRDCALVGIELTDDAVDLPSFRHPVRAAYVLGPERGSLSPEMIARCDHIIKIPTSFCINVGTAGAIVLYDRVQSLGRFAPRPVASGGPGEALEVHSHGAPKSRTKNRYLPD